MASYESGETNISQQPQGSVPAMRSVPLVQGQNKHHPINGTAYQCTRGRNTNDERKTLNPMSKTKNSNVPFTKLHGNNKYLGEGKNYYLPVNQPVSGLVSAPGSALVSVPVNAPLSNHPNRIQMNNITYSFNDNGESSHMNKFGYHKEGRSKNCMLVPDPMIRNAARRSSYGEYKMSGPKLTSTYRNDRNSYAVLNRANELNFPPGCNNNGMAPSEMMQESPPGCGEERTLEQKVDMSNEEKKNTEEMRIHNIITKEGKHNQIFNPTVGGKQGGGEMQGLTQRTEQILLNPGEDMQKGKVDPMFDHSIKQVEMGSFALQNNSNCNAHRDDYNQVKYLAKPMTREKGNVDFTTKRKNYRNGAYNNFFTPYEHRLNLLKKKEPPPSSAPFVCFNTNSKGDQSFEKPLYEKRRHAVPRGSGLLPQVHIPPPHINDVAPVVKYSGETLYNGVTPVGTSLLCTPTLCASPPRPEGRTSLIDLTAKRPRGSILNSLAKDKEGRRRFLPKSNESVDSNCFMYNSSELGSLSPDMRTSASLNVCLSLGLNKKSKKGLGLEGLPKNTNSMNHKVHPMTDLFLSNNAKGGSSRKKKGSKSFSLNLCSACLNIDDGIYLKQINEIINRNIIFSEDDLLIMDQLTKSSIHNSYIFNNVKSVSSFRKGGLNWIVYNNHGGYPCTKTQKQVTINYDKADTEQQCAHIGGGGGGGDINDGEGTYVDLIKKNIFCTNKYIIEPTIENTWLKKVLLIIKKEELDLDAFFFKLKYYFYKSVLFLYQEGIKSYLGDVANQMKIYINYNFWSASEVAFILRQLTNLCSIQIEVRVKGEIGCVIYLNNEPKGFQGFVDSHNLNDTFTKKDWILLHRFAIKMMQYKKEGSEDQGRSEPPSPALLATATEQMNEVEEEQGKERHSESGNIRSNDTCAPPCEDENDANLSDELLSRGDGDRDRDRNSSSLNVDSPFGEDKLVSGGYMELLSPASVTLAAALSKTIREEEVKEEPTEAITNVGSISSGNPAQGRSEDGSECIFCSPTTKKLKSYMFNGGRYAFAAKLKHEIKHFKSKRLGDIIHLVQLAIHKGIFVYSQRILLPVSACEKSAEDLYPKIKNFNYELCETLGEVMRIISLLVDHKPNGLVLAQLKQQFILQFKKELNSLHFGYKKLQNLLLAEPFSKHYKLYIPNCNMHRTHIQHKKYRIPDNCRIFQKESINVGSFLEFIDHHEFGTYNVEEEDGDMDGDNDGEDEEQAEEITPLEEHTNVTTQMSAPLPTRNHTNELLNSEKASAAPVDTESQTEQNQDIQMYENSQESQEHGNTTEHAISKRGILSNKEDQTSSQHCRPVCTDEVEAFNVPLTWQMNRETTKPRGTKKGDHLSYKNLMNLPLFIRESIQMTLESQEDDRCTYLNMSHAAQFFTDQDEGSTLEDSNSKQRNDMYLSMLSRMAYAAEEGNTNNKGEEAPTEVTKHSCKENECGGGSNVLSMLCRMDLDAKDAHAEKLRGIMEIFASTKRQHERHPTHENENQQDNIWHYTPVCDDTEKDSTVAATSKMVTLPPLLNIFTLIKKYKRKKKNCQLSLEQRNNNSDIWRSKISEEDVPQQHDGEDKSNETKMVSLNNDPGLGSGPTDVSSGSPGNKFLRFKKDSKLCNSSRTGVDMEGTKAVRPFGKNGFYEKGAFTSADYVANTMREEDNSGESHFDLNKVRQNYFQYVKKNQGGGSLSPSYHLGKRGKSFIKDSSSSVAHGGEVVSPARSTMQSPLLPPNYLPPCAPTNVKQNGQHTPYDTQLGRFDRETNQMTDCKIVQNNIPGECCNIWDDTSQTGKNAKGQLYRPPQGGEENTPCGDYCQSSDLNLCEPMRLEADNGYTINEKTSHGVPPMGSSVDKKCSPPEGTREEHLCMGGQNPHFYNYNFTQGKNTNMHSGENKPWGTELSSSPDSNMNVSKNAQADGDTCIYAAPHKLAEGLVPFKSHVANQSGKSFQGEQVEEGLSVDTAPWGKNADLLGPPQRSTNNLISEQVQNTKDKNSQNDSLKHANGNVYHVEGENGFPSSGALSSEKAPAHQAGGDIHDAINCTYLKKTNFINCDLNRVGGNTDNNSNSTTTTTTTVANNINGGSNNSGHSDSVVDYHSGDSNTQERDTTDRSENDCYAQSANQVGQEKSVGASAEVKTDGLLPHLSGHVEESNKGLNKQLTYRLNSDEVQNLGGNNTGDTPANSVTQSGYTHQYTRQYVHQQNYPPSDKKRGTYTCNDKEIDQGKRQYNPFESRNSFTRATASYRGGPNNLRDGYKRENDMKKNFFKKNEIESNPQMTDILNINNHAKGGEGLFFSPQNEGKNFRNVITNMSTIRQEKLQTPNGSSFHYRNDKNEHAFKSRSILKRNKYVDPNAGFNQDRKKNNHQIPNPVEKGYQQREREAGTEAETGTDGERQRRTSNSRYAKVDKMDNPVTYMGRTPDTLLHKHNGDPKNNFLQSSYFPYQQNKKNGFIKYGDVETSYGNHKEVKKPQFRKFFNCAADTGTSMTNEGTANFGKICKIRNIYMDQFPRKYFPGETNKFCNANLNYSYQNKSNVDLPPASNEYVKFSSLVKGKTRINADPSFVENGAFKVGVPMQDQVRDQASLGEV
ncbi:hypothetical protein AK88_01434 [Plasmodium fragile]|uniref:HTH OST-type domain-containing protein n=1 Tax=Plasmodium fragile TaxID=5857 RepID=A0A0D9QPB1_PLAFR|nr:uncharacterized protein AK88_01434 [Plasmodium fragile]KJP88940.1 hypothetical protein AK88_01434 [Plasmodium fragile]